MSRTTSVHFSPPVGCRINLVNSKSGETVVASTLSIRDKTPFKHRTPKGTPKGKEYFYVKIHEGKGWKYIKMLNSLILPNCISEDGNFLFYGELPSGGSLTGGTNKAVFRKNLMKSSGIKAPKELQNFVNTSILNT